MCACLCVCMRDCMIVKKDLKCRRSVPSFPLGHIRFFSLSQVRNADSVIRHAPSTYLLIAAAPQ